VAEGLGIEARDGSRVRASSERKSGSKHLPGKIHVLAIRQPLIKATDSESMLSAIHARTSRDNREILSDRVHVFHALMKIVPIAVEKGRSSIMLGIQRPLCGADEPALEKLDHVVEPVGSNHSIRIDECDEIAGRLPQPDISRGCTIQR
jgi:hypothetical protein